MAIVKWLRIGWEEEKKTGQNDMARLFYLVKFYYISFSIHNKKKCFDTTQLTVITHTHSRTQIWLLLTTILFLFSLAIYELNFCEYCLDSCHSLKAFQNRNMQWNYNWSNDKMKFHLHTNLWKFFAISCPQ